MRRILEPGQIEAFAEGAIPRLRLPERTTVFAARARRLRQHGAPGAPGSGSASIRLPGEAAGGAGASSRTGSEAGKNSASSSFA